MATCFLVLGTPRSGTSCIAGVLQKLGVFVGEKLFPANEMNEMGFFQDVEFENLFNACPEWMPEYPGRDLCDVNALHSLIVKRCKAHETWGLKIRLGAFIVQEIERFCDVKLIVTQRDRDASIASLAKWSEAGDQDPSEVIDRASRAVKAACEGRDVIDISYADLLASTEIEVDRIAAHAGQVKTAESVTFVDPALRRY